PGALVGTAAAGALPPLGSDKGDFDTVGAAGFAAAAALAPAHAGNIHSGHVAFPSGRLTTPRRPAERTPWSRPSPMPWTAGRQRRPYRRRPQAPSPNTARRPRGRGRRARARPGRRS